MSQNESVSNEERGLEKTKEQLIVPMHFGKFVHMGYFATFDNSIKKGDCMLVRSERGTELAYALSAPYLASEYQGEVFGKVLRLSRMTERSKRSELSDGVEKEMKYSCQQMAAEFGLDMKVQDVEYILGGERVIFYFTSVGRVDFRQLVKNLASKYHTRIEMRQIGFRDNAKLFGGFGKCGLELCCTTWLKNFPDVNMKMAIMQKGSTEQNKVNGQCGKLMCCLAYEDQLYQKLKENLPDRGQKIQANEQQGNVINIDILNQKVTFVTEMNEYFTVNQKEITKTFPIERQEGHE